MDKRMLHLFRKLNPSDKFTKLNEYLERDAVGDIDPINPVGEGVGDTYSSQEFGIEEPHAGFEKKYAGEELKANNAVIYEDGNWKIIKNPSNINNIGANARGVILANGDLYMESYGGEHIHNDILKILFEQGIIPTLPRKNWTGRLPQETGFMTVQRYRNSPYIAIGESNKLIYDTEGYERYIRDYKQFLDRAHHKNPTLTFTDKLVGTKYLRSTGDSSNLMNESYL